MSFRRKRGFPPRHGAIGDRQHADRPSNGRAAFRISSTEPFSDDVPARELEDATGLTTAWIVPEDRQAMDPAAEMPVVAASVFLDLINKGDRIGVVWGRTVYHIADVMPFADLRGGALLQQPDLVEACRRLAEAVDA
jgi:hypothetical protein